MEEPDEVIISLLQIQRKYEAMKQELGHCYQRMDTLKAENTLLRKEVQLLKSHASQSPLKRRKTKSPDSSGFESTANTSTNHANQSNSTFEQDEFNVAIQEMSYRSEENNENINDHDEEEISATPVPEQSGLKRDRFKQLTISDTSLAKQFTETYHPKIIVKHENISSPLRGIENFRSDQHENSPNRKSKRGSEVRALVFEDESVTAFNKSDRRDSIAHRKIPLSLSRSRLKQSVLNFSVESPKVKREQNSVLDETYCQDVTTMSKTKSNSCVQPKIEPTETTRTDESIYWFGHKTTVKNEPITQQVPSIEHQSNNSSVFVLPTQTDEIQIVEDSEPMFTSPVKSEPDFMGQTDDMPTKTLRTEYKQPVALRTIKEKAAQPGFTCADCEAWFRYIGNGLSEREIQRRLDKCSKHRTDEFDKPGTPEGFWLPYIAPTQELDPAPVLVHSRIKKRPN